ncbi:hypothetical protein CHU93_16775 [Sandarakinorhabdus cyanobacteriorum]|uniref:Transposase IS66 central domain-containing protein n=1 Tax=Sandarakinorhabdus cyanobacteriorum TaxID=1981098 RepID=A0A255Y403_9SPHN|nr:hypothetical protein CHU93_16775 [Sandarakinorhabdus cyanobacteriorum]
MPRAFADETAALAFDPGNQSTKTGQLLADARDDRRWGGTDPPAVAFLYPPDRRGERPKAHPIGFSCILQVDGYAGCRATEHLLLLPPTRLAGPMHPR